MKSASPSARRLAVRSRPCTNAGTATAAPKATKAIANRIAPVEKFVQKTSS